MSLTAEDLKTSLSVLAFVVSVVSLVLTRVNWRQSNRPVVSAFIVEESMGDGVATFNLSVANTGSRPATSIRLRMEPSEFSKLLDPSADAEAKMQLARCFARDSVVPLLRNGEVLTGALGHSSRNPINKPQLNYGADAEILIEYSDLDGKQYKSIQPVKVYPRDGFTGSSWQSAA